MENVPAFMKVQDIKHVYVLLNTSKTSVCAWMKYIGLVIAVAKHDTYICVK